MNTDIREQVSAFVDGELGASESELLVRRFERDPEVKAYAADLISLRQQMRGETSFADASFAAGIAARIAQEEALEAAPAATSGGSGLLRLAAGGGIAAAVAWFALTSLPGDNLGTAPTTAAEVSGTAAQPPEASMEDVSYVVPATMTDSGLVNADPELAAYYLRHSASERGLVPAQGRYRMVTGDEPEEVIDTALDVAAGAPE